jgi:hypothetical protein
MKASSFSSGGLSEKKETTEFLKAKKVSSSRSQN